MMGDIHICLCGTMFIEDWYIYLRGDDPLCYECAMIHTDDGPIWDTYGVTRGTAPGWDDI